MAVLRPLLLLSLALGHARRATSLQALTPAAGCRPDELPFRYCGNLLCHSLTPALPFAAALRTCARAGGRLATVYSQAHNDQLYGMLTRSAYIGAVARQRMVRHPRGEPAGPGVIWAWLSGEPAHFTNMLPSETPGFYRQPDGGGFEGCVELMRHRVLHDDPATEDETPVPRAAWTAGEPRDETLLDCARAARLGRPFWVVVLRGRFTNFHRYGAYGLPDEPNESPNACAIVWFDGNIVRLL
ncbi:uncharacterized protein LOC119093335 [Pollicipes pollicipes]|uniref:uncharacterized protein LOC119093335 n=1 Tax=Pollicipes pollicipes TaxID=41117 RepID=UPI001885415F|nr:uncharacterized protein LOC119093335 [Pollicipes pollicipes]